MIRICLGSTGLYRLQDCSLRVNGYKTFDKVREQITRIGVLARELYLSSEHWRNDEHYQDWVMVATHYGAWHRLFHYNIDCSNVALGIWWLRGNGTRTLDDLFEKGDFNEYMTNEHIYEHITIEA